MSAATAALDALAPFGFEYVEQPLAAADVEGLARLRVRSPVRIAADEAVTSEQGALRLIELRAADVIVLKPAVLGGAVRALELAGRARDAGIGAVFTHTFESAVGARHSLHCAAAWGDATLAHGLCTDGLFSSDVAAPVACSSGFAVLDGSAGIGVAP
jgi:L-alanine-DL-glutamate epimerase-like enolase superfamily enzyme